MFNAITARACPWRRLAVWCFLRLNDEIRAAESSILPGTGLFGCAILDLLDKIAKTGLRAENVLCVRLQGRPCPYHQGNLAALDILHSGVPILLPAGSPGFAEVPDWDSDLRVLMFGGQIVKRFRQAAPNQETILTVFKESLWAEEIDDPLSPKGKVDPKQRLHSTIQHLNGSQVHKLLEFHGDGTGQRIRWAPAAKPPPE